MTEILGVKIV